MKIEVSITVVGDGKTEYSTDKIVTVALSEELAIPTRASTAETKVEAEVKRLVGDAVDRAAAQADLYYAGRMDEERVEKQAERRRRQEEALDEELDRA